MSESALSRPAALRAPAGKRVPGDVAMWCFILSELAVFGVLFLSFGVARLREPAVFAAGQARLELMSGTVNTALLLTGSATMAAAVRAFAARRQRAGQWLLALTLATGLGFLVLKAGELAGKFSAGITLSSDTFWMFYLALAVFHFLHVVLGMVIVGAVACFARDGRYLGKVEGVETAASYWHLVDLVWVVLFALVYVAR